MMISEGSWIIFFTRPISLSLILLLCAILVAPLIRKGSKKTPESGDERKATSTGLKKPVVRSVFLAWFTPTSCVRE